MTTFETDLAEICREHLPSRHLFFSALATAPLLRSDQLGDLHLIYQSAMHATRAAVYHLPYLDSPAMRKRKLRIFIDDDGLPGGDTHHYQLTRAFRGIGATIRMEDEEFGDAWELSTSLFARGFPETSEFILKVDGCYRESLGPWCLIEALSVDWMTALANGLAAHFPTVRDEPYFAECFANQVEERHADEALEVTLEVLRDRPELTAKFVSDAAVTARKLDGVWADMLDVIR